MSKKYLVSKSGLTRCPACERHIFLAEDWIETHCGFCRMHLVASDAPGESKVVSVSRPGRSGLLAAGLLSVSIGAVGCIDDSEPKTKADQGMSGPPATMNMAGMPVSGGQKQNVDMALVQPVYGAPSPDITPTIDMGVQADMELDQPVYGAPGPDIEPELDAAMEPEPQPEYGAPPEEG